MGMSVGDFCSLSPDEFAACCRAYADNAAATERGAWERTRLHAAICIQPHIKKKLTPRQLVPLPWDTKPARAGTKQPPKPIDRAREKARFERLAAQAHHQ